VHRRQAGVARARTIAAPLFEVIQEGTDQGRIQIM